MTISQTLEVVIGLIFVYYVMGSIVSLITGSRCWNGTVGISASEVRLTAESKSNRRR